MLWLPPESQLTPDDLEIWGQEVMILLPLYKLAAIHASLVLTLCRPEITGQIAEFINELATDMEDYMESAGGKPPLGNWRATTDDIPSEEGG